MKFMSWNINGVSSVLNNCEYRPTLELFNADIYAFQETKVTDKDYRMLLLGFNAYWSFHKTSTSLHPQSGTLILSKEAAKHHYITFPNAPDFDTEGRLIVLEYESFFFVNVYVPQSQDEVSARSDRKSLERKEYRARFDRLFREYMEKLDENKPVIICGDFNAAISKIDMASDSRWQDGNGFAKDTNHQLRQLVKIGFTDTFRYLHPNTEGAYTHYWLNDKDGSKGRRLDYFFVSSDLKSKITSADIHANIKGSDHLPITLELDVKTIKKRNMKLHHLTYDDLLERERRKTFFKDLKDVDLSYAWDTINWKEVETRVILGQKEIAEAALTFDPDKIRDVQYWFVKKLDSKVYAVREVASKKKHAGIDKVKWTTSDDKMHAAISLTSKHYHALPALARDIEDPAGKPRQINCDTYKDTAMQELYSMSLAPVQESWSDRKSFSNRKGRSIADADYYIKEIYSGDKAPLWAVKTDVKKCYASLSHKWFIKYVPMATNVLIEFLNASYFKDDKFYDYDRGIGLGSRMSPFLANFAMDGLQDYIYYKLNNSYEEPDDKDNGHMIRFADDILVSARDNDSAILIREAIKEYLGNRELELSVEKTKIIYLPAEGFDYLGKHYEKVGNRIKSCPSTGSILRFKKKIEDITFSQKWSPESIVEELNKAIATFSNQHRMTEAEDVFRDLDVFICAQLIKLCDRFFDMEDKEKYLKDYFLKRDRCMQFIVKGSPQLKVNFLQDSNWIRHKPLPLELNPYIDIEEFNEYSKNREIENMTGIYKTIWERQEGCCAYCNGEICPDDIKEIIEIDPSAKRKEERLAYIHSRCKNMSFVTALDEPEYLESHSTISLLLDLDSRDTYDIEDNPLYQYFKNATHRTVNIKIEDIKTLCGIEFDTNAAKEKEFWERKPEDRLGQCWHKNGFYFIGFTSKSHTSVVFRKMIYKGNEVKYHIPDIVMNGLLKPRTARKIDEAVNYILEEEGYPTY
ncbi:MAG: reverse transcriptase N-terminal domain-containing protein [Lachnospiraceae bacterium]|nr:reverse transcriptase N-terminal domain-containing protein [Lachnospiraceae bacterium]